ncbi:MAG: S1C family serine protease [Clostridia bacterium]|nr:S1C family serine protease [Clostridia bacterium]
MKKKLFLSITAAAVLSLGVFAGCNLSQTPYVTSIEKSQSVGLVDYYTITYSDGTTSQFTVTNGKNGSDGQDGNDAQSVTANDVYETYKSLYGDELTFKEFCEKYLTVNTDSTAALNSCLRSCLKVYTVFHEVSYSGIGWGQTSTVKEASYCGSAVVYKMEEEYTYILTNYHVMYDSSAVAADGSRLKEKIAEKTWVYLYGSEYSPVQDSITGEITISSLDTYAVECEYVGGSITYDVAVIKAKTEDLKKVNPQVCPVTVSYDFSVGEHTYAVGNPDDGGISVTEGVVSVDSDIIELSIDGTARSYRSIRTDTALTHGNSGGGLFNMNGELIGLNNAGDEDITSMNFAIPASVLTAVADGVLYYNAADATVKNTYVTRLGVTVRSNNSRYVYDAATGKGAIKEDVTVEEITSGGLFEASGLQAGDVITSMTLNGKTTYITRQFKMTDVLLAARSGDTLVFGYTRDGVQAQSQALTVRENDVIKVD